MRKELTFDIESLLIGIENPKGPIEQVLFANRHAKHIGKIAFSNLARITFSNPEINQALPGTAQIDETLLIGYEGFAESEIHLCLRSGKDALQIATGYFPERKIKIHSEYHHAILLSKLNDLEINKLLTYVWINRELIEPKPIPNTDF